LAHSLKRKTKFLNDYEFEKTDVSTEQCLVSLRCLNYQCNEGDIDKTELYKDLKHVAYVLTEIILLKNKKFKDAEWG